MQAIDFTKLQLCNKMYAVTLQNQVLFCKILPL